MRKATTFEFTSFSFEPRKKRVFFDYKTIFNDGSSLSFRETIVLPKTVKKNNIPGDLLEKLLSSLHLMLGISYYKLYCPQRLQLPYVLSKEEASFWDTIYKKGLGEFFYRNQLSPKIMPKFPYHKKAKNITYSLQKTDRCLVGMGGGKESIVALELLKQNHFDIATFKIATNTKPLFVEKVLKKLGLRNLTIHRFLDKKVINEIHQYQGHVPISAIYAFLGIFTGVLYGYSYVIVGNERSSNFGNITYQGLAINHQWSKSFEFEMLFSNYLKQFITSDIHYFSLLRSFYEIRITRMFSDLGQYFRIFSSCNSNFKIKKERKNLLWCLRCPKCIFVFILLSAFLKKKELTSIFGKNLYQSQDLLLIFKDVLGFGKMKPFDCVGTFQEARVALFLASKKGFSSDFIMRQLLRQLKVTKKDIEEVFSASKESNVPEPFFFLGMEKILILGYGKEGKISEKYLKKYHPESTIKITDKKQGRGYLEKQKDFDVAIKTPGIKKELVTIKYTTATNLFLSKVSGKNLVIGVTGSKGKSTTASLIYQILKEGGKKVKLLGNIGKPMLESLLKPVSRDTIFVLELSSAQLDDVSYSPDISVVTRLFPEHMDYHGSINQYYQAKKHIIDFQNANNYFVYHPKDKILRTWLKGYEGNSIPFDRKMKIETKLIGQHNRDNIGAAIAVAKIFSIKETIIKKAVKEFKGLNHRLEYVGKFKGIEFYDDAISTTPESTIAAIQSLKKVDTIFLGGEDRGYDFTDLEKTIKRYRIKNIVLFPESGKKMLTSRKGLRIKKTSRMEDAVAFAFKYTKKNHICLLSTASPSYSLWENFEEKGNDFKRAVKKLSIK